MNKKLTYAVLTSVLLLSFAYNIIFASSTTFNQYYASRSSSYIIYNDGGIYIAVSGLTGAIDYSGANASTVIQSVVNALTSGGSIFLKSGTYTLTSHITSADNIIWIGEGKSTKITSESNNYSLYLGHNNRVTNVFFETFGSVAGSGTAIVISGKNDCMIDHCWFTNTHNAAIALQLNPSRAIITDNNIVSCTKYGIVMDSGKDVIISGNIIKDTTWQGIAAYGASMDNLVIIGNNLESSSGSYDTAIQVASTGTIKRVSIQGNIVNGAVNYGISLRVNDNTDYVLTDVTVSGNVIRNIANQAIYVYAINGNGNLSNISMSNNVITDYGIGTIYKNGIKITSAQRVSIIGNIIRTTETASSDIRAIMLNQYENVWSKYYGFTIIGNVISAPNISGNKYWLTLQKHEDVKASDNVIENSMTIENAGYTGKIDHNIGFVTENSGTATGTSPIVVAHGLAGTPTIVTLGVQGVRPYSVSWTANSTHIMIYHSAVKKITVTWYAEYKP